MAFDIEKFNQHMEQVYLNTIKDCSILTIDGCCPCCVGQGWIQIVSDFCYECEMLNIQFYDKYRIRIHIDQIKRCDFSLFNTDEKYALLVLIMKYLLPLVTLNVNASCNIGNNIFKTNLNLINRRFNSTEKYLNDKILRQAFLGKNNKLNNNLGKSRTLSVFSNSIPVLRKTQSNIDKRLLDPKYQAVF